MKTNFSVVVATALFSSATFFSPVSNAQETTAFVGAKIHTGTGDSYENGALVIRDGKIVSVGPASSVPQGVQQIDVSNKVIIPGMIDNHIHIGADLENLNEFPTAFQPQNRVIDALSPDHDSWERALRAGITTVATGTGSGEVMSGEWAIVKTFGPTLESRLLREQGGLKFALDSASAPGGPKTDPAVFSEARALLIQAREYIAAREAWENGPKKEPQPPRDLKLETLARALSGEEEVRAHLHTPNQIRGAISLAEEFGLDLQLHHATFAYKVIDDIAAANLPVVGVPLFTKFGFRDDVLEAPGELAKAGVRFVFHSDDPAASAKWFRHTGGLAIRYGMTEDAALKGLTSDAAILAHVEDQTGSLAPGKDADFVVLDGPWFEMTTRTEQVYVDGALAFDADRDIEPPSPSPAPERDHWTNPLNPDKWAAPTNRQRVSPLIAIRGGTIHTNDGDPIENGVLLLENGKVRRVGSQNSVRIPQDAQIIEAAGKHIIPGLIDAASHYGISGNNLSETAAPLNPQRRAVDAYAPRMLDTEQDTGPMRAVELLSGGVTTQYVRLGGSTVIDGQGVLVKTAAPDVNSAVLREPAGMSINVTSRPTRTFREKEQSPVTLSAVIASLREALVKASELNAKSRSEKKDLPRDLGQEALAAMLSGEMPARIEATAPSHLRSALRVAEEFDLPLIIEGGTAAFTMRDELAAKKIPVILGLTSAPYPTGGEVPDEDDFPIIDERNAALLAEAGVPFAIASYSQDFGSLAGPYTGKHLLLEAAIAVGYGLSEADALRAITLWPAEILGLDSRIGSISSGKDADIVILDGPPFATTARPSQVFVDGVSVYTR